MDTVLLQERIAFLEKELVETKLQLAQAKSSEDKLKLELARVRSSALAGATPSRADMGTTGRNNESKRKSSSSNSKVVSVPTADAFSRKKARRARPLNPGSCSSALNLMALVDHGSRSSSLGRTSVLNPGSCASALNLLMGLSVTPMATSSSSHLLLGQDSSSSASPRSSNGHFAALLGELGSARLLSNSSFSRRNGTNGATRRPGNSISIRDGSNKNEGWDLFEQM